jgi:Fe-S-cluster containining protein
VALPAAARAALAEVYARADAAIEAASPRCEMSGRCCRFDEFGHELWSTALETEYARQAGAAQPGPQLPELAEKAPPGRCPWHVGGLCTLRDGRPLGCRTFFCDPDWDEEGKALHERLHREIVALHETHGLDYRYGRFVEGLSDPPAPEPPPEPEPPPCAP